MESGSKRARIISEPVRYMDKLDEFILIEILLRLPSVRSVTQCKQVCPHWNSVISCPHFQTNFLDHHHSTTSSNQRKPFSMILAQQRPTLRIYTMLSNDSNFKGFDHNFPVSLIESATPYNHTTLSLEIVATYNELLLCLHRYRRDSSREVIVKLHVYNPLTKQHVALPPSPKRICYTTNDVVGLLCRGRSSFRVVHILQTWDSDRMHIFSSEENKWREYDLAAIGFGGTMVSYGCVMALPWNGLLCWMSYNNDLIVCDPYSPDDDQHFHFMTTPPREEDDFSSGVGVFGGTLRLWRLHGGLFRVWELKDYDREEWSLKHQVEMDRHVTAIRAAAFDPNDEDVVYYATSDSVISLNMRSRDSSPVKASLETKVNLPRFEEYIGWGGNDITFFMLVMERFFPTPIPAIPSKNDRIRASKPRKAKKLNR